MGVELPAQRHKKGHSSAWFTKVRWFNVTEYYHYAYLCPYAFWVQPQPPLVNPTPEAQHSAAEPTRDSDTDPKWSKKPFISTSWPRSSVGLQGGGSHLSNPPKLVFLLAILVLEGKTAGQHPLVCHFLKAIGTVTSLRTVLCLWNSTITLWALAKPAEDMDLRVLIKDML